MLQQNLSSFCLSDWDFGGESSPSCYKSLGVQHVTQWDAVKNCAKLGVGANLVSPKEGKPESEFLVKKYMPHTDFVWIGPTGIFCYFSRG